MWQSLPAHLADKFLEARKLLLDEIDAGLVLLLQRLLVELARRHADEDFRPQENHRLKKHEDLPPLILHAPATERTAGDRLQRDRLVLERLVLHARHPVDRILQPAGKAVIFFWAHDAHAV